MASERIQRRIERLLDQIEQEADQQNWQVVRDLGDEVLGLAPDNADALAFLSAAERRLSSTSEGEAKQFISPEPSTPAATASEAERRQLTAHRNMGTVTLLKGELALAREHWLQGISRHDIQQHRSLALNYGLEPTCSALAWSTRNQWLLGYLDQASSHLQEALTLAQEVSHPFTLAFVELQAALHYIESRAIQSALHYTEALLGLAQEQGFAFYLPYAAILQGACLVQMGRTQEGVASLTQGLATFARMGVMMARSVTLSWLAEAHLIAGQSEDGMKVLTEAFTFVKESGERIWEADLYRVRGELLPLPGGSKGEAEECFNQALKIARSQSAKSLELRAALSLTRLWQNQGKRTEARELLAGIYGWFTEGFDTPDLIDAKALLEELA